MSEQAAGPGADGGPAGRPLVRAARAERGWSQSRAAAELAGLAGADAPVPASLKTQLSRWENGHAEPDAAHRALLAALYRRDPADLGLGPAPAGERPGGAADAGDPVRDLHRALAEADGVDEAGLTAWRDQLGAAARLDHRLGTAGAGQVVEALRERMVTLLAHVVDEGIARELAALVAEAGLLAGEQARDRQDVRTAWTRLDEAGRSARQAGRADLADRATAGRARLLVEAGRPGHARRALAGADGPWAASVRSELEPTPRSAPVDVVAPAIGVDVAALRHHRSLARVRDGDAAARAELHRTVDDPARPARERTEAEAELAVAALRGGEPDAVAQAARAQVRALRTGSARLVDRLARAGAGTTSGPIR